MPQQALTSSAGRFVSDEKEHLILIVNRSESETVSPAATSWLFNDSLSFKILNYLIQNSAYFTTKNLKINISFDIWFQELLVKSQLNI